MRGEVGEWEGSGRGGRRVEGRAVSERGGRSKRGEEEQNKWRWEAHHMYYVHDCSSTQSVV